MSGTTRDLKRRLKSITVTEQMTKAMKTVAVSKYNRTLGISQKFEEYAAQCQHLLSVLGGKSAENADETPRSGVCYVLVTGDRGLCGMYNIELMRYIQELINRQNRKVSLVICGKWGIANSSDITGAEIVGTFALDSVPEYDQARQLGEYLQKLYSDGNYEEISFVVQKFKNVLVQTPGVMPFLPQSRKQKQQEDTQEYIFAPEREKILSNLVKICTDAEVYRVLLNCAMGVHGATLAAMRTASENSEQMYEELSLELNRIRQMSATTEVIELSSSASAEYD
jgi:F-type H+-transporting ATPase subunit gamma